MNKKEKMNTLAFMLLLIAAEILLLHVVIDTKKADGAVCSDTIRIEKTDTLWVHDTVPEIRSERVVKYVVIDAAKKDTATAAAEQRHTEKDTMEVVQREYGDSSYTAWVSGIKYGVWPSLDSIAVRERMVTRETIVTNTVTKRRKWHVGVTAGYGYGLRSRSAEPFVGVGVVYTPW